MLFLMIFNTNTINRIKNISFKNASLMERFISFKDVFGQVPQNLLGKGANSYEYGQYIYKSAFYESKYIHNSMLQQLYDQGLIGLLIFSLMLTYVFFVIMKSSNKNKKYYLTIYITIFLHSMLNFDMIFPTFWIIISALMAFSTTRSSINFNYSLTKIMLIILIIFSIPLSYHEAIIRLSNNSTIKNKQGFSLKLLTLQGNMKIKDERLYFIKSSAEKLNFDKSKNTQYLESAIENQKYAQSLNDIDPRIKWNLAFLLTKNKQYKEAQILWDKILSKEGYSNTTYKAYYEFLSEAYINNSEEKEKKIKELTEIFDFNKGNLPPTAQLLPNQLKNTLKETLSEKP